MKNTTENCKLLVTDIAFGKRGFFTYDEEIKPVYEVVFEGEWFGIFGKEKTTGETVFIKRIAKEKSCALRLAEILNENKVSVYHAKDVLKDFLVEPLL